MSRYHRREFLADVGRGMLVAGVGSAPAYDLGLAPAALAAGSDERLTFGPMEPLVALMQETPAEALLPAVIERINSGTDLRELVAAAALANARTFGGQDYDGYHAIMALAPAYQMSRELPESRRALPVMKVLYRNTSHIQQMGGRTHEVPSCGRSGHRTRGPAGSRSSARGDSAPGHGGIGASLCRLGAAGRSTRRTTSFSMSSRIISTCTGWSLPGGRGPCLISRARTRPHAALRQSVRFCVDEEGSLHRNKNHGEEELRALLPKLLERKGLASRAPGDRRPDDEWVDRMCHTIYERRAGSKRPRRSQRLWLRGSHPRSLARRSPWLRTSSCCTIPAVRRKTGPRSRSGASTAHRSACTLVTRRTRGATSRASVTDATRMPV